MKSKIYNAAVRSSEKDFETLQLGAFATPGLLLAQGPAGLTAEFGINGTQSSWIHPLLLGITLFLCAGFTPQFVLAQDNVTAKLIEGAKKEGKMVFYSSLNIEDNNGLLKKFEEKYPFIKTELNRLSADVS